jgi:polysaccharide deacetylase family protein (PEP-CTERM system associated)
MAKTNFKTSRKYATLSFDIEDWFQVESMKSKFPFDTWEDQELRVEKNTQLILKLLRRHDVKGTFFILGWIADKVPELIRQIHQEGHEIASHGYYHKLNYKMSSEELHEDLKKSKELLEKITGDTVLGYRAPTFSITDAAVDALIDIGYRYDSSWNKFANHDRYGKLESVEIEKTGSEAIYILNKKLTELCLPVESLFSKTIPIAGGGFFRLYPLWFTKMMVRKYFEKKEYYMFYSHPWEFDKSQPRIHNLELSNRIRHYINLDNNADKTDSFIKFLKEMNVTFVTAGDYNRQSFKPCSKEGR